MRENDAGWGPRIGADARSLGVRAKDVTIGEHGSVRASQEGMSVSPMPPENLPTHRRPQEFGGSGKDPVWVLETEDLPEGLEYVPDPVNSDTHGFIAPAYRMTFEHYQQILAETGELWSLV